MSALTDKERDAIKRLIKFVEGKITDILDDLPNAIEGIVASGSIGEKEEYLNDAVMDELQAAIDEASHWSYKDLEPKERKLLFGIHYDLHYEDAEEKIMGRGGQ